MKYGNVFLRSSLASTFPCTLYRKLTDKASPSCLRIVNDTCKYVSSQPKIITLHYFLSVSMHSPKNFLFLVMAGLFIVSKHWGSKAVKKSASEHTSTSAYFMCTCMMLCRHHKSNYYFNNCSKENIV